MQKIDSKDQFEILLSENKNVLVDFSAAWCGPCKVLLPQLEEAEKEAQANLDISSVKFTKVDVDSEGVSDVLSRFNIKNVPTVIMFNDGAVKDRFVGAKTKAQILDFIKATLN